MAATQVRLSSRADGSPGTDFQMTIGYPIERRAFAANPGTVSTERTQRRYGKGTTAMDQAGHRRLLVDGNNLMGAGAGGWWRDPPRAVRELVDRLRCYGAATGEHPEIVLDVPQPDLPEGDHDGVVVHYATRRGRDAADDRIVELLDADRDAVADQDAVVEVVTSDRDLAERARQRGALVTGAGRFLARLKDAGC
jgi:predicted RNA-binding protein with PIN domain